MGIYHRAIPPALASFGEQVADSSSALEADGSFWGKKPQRWCCHRSSPPAEKLVFGIIVG
jgi:hypothetical protein